MVALVLSIGEWSKQQFGSCELGDKRTTSRRTAVGPLMIAVALMAPCLSQLGRAASPEPKSAVEKARGVELANPETFWTWTHEQPWMVLHELAHGYHDQVLGHDHKGIRECYERAVASKSYESVLHYDGRKVRHYALNNDKEYFAEATEAFFGTNDFYPFVRSELLAHDPKMHELLKKVWGVTK
jgi:hypothetical protein